MSVKTQKERRRHKRYPVEERVIAIIRSKTHALERIDSLSKGGIAMAIIKSDPLRMGEIVEISRSSLSFRHIDTERILESPCEMDILFSDGDFHLSRLPIKTVKERIILSEMPFDVLKMKCLTVKFGGLTDRQKTKLEQLLQNISVEKKTKRGKQVWGGRTKQHQHVASNTPWPSGDRHTCRNPSGGHGRQERS